MAKLITHKFVSTIPDGDDASLVKPSNWNDTHDVSGVAESGANTDITSLSGITGGISSPDYIQFDTTYATPLTTGQLGWDGNNTLGLGMSGGNIVQEIGLQSYIYGKATSAITKGQLIKKTGANGSSGVITFAPTTANMTNSGDVIGIAAEDIALNGFGYITSVGNLRGFNTTGSSSGETWADGDTLYYNPSGNGLMTKVKPSAPNIKTEVAIVTNAGSGGSGSVVVEIIHGSQLGGTDSNVQITSASNGNVLTYDGGNGYWKNTDLASGTGISITKSVNGVLTVTNTSPNTYDPTNVAITGGTINGTTIGATTPSTGKFTTLESTGTGSFGTASAQYIQAVGDAIYPQVLAAGSGTNIPLILQPKGTGALQAQKTDSTATGGNARGANAVDWQTTRTAAAQVASAINSVLAGGQNNTSGSFASAILGGVGNTTAGSVGYQFVGGGLTNASGTGSTGWSAILGGDNNTAAGFYNIIGGGYLNSCTSGSAVTTQVGATTSGSTAVTLTGSNANIKVGQYITGTGISSRTYVAAISGTSLTLSQNAASNQASTTLSFFTPHGVVVGGGNNQATGSYSFIGGGGDAGTSGNRNVASGDWSVVGGGFKNSAIGIYGTVAGGYNNTSGSTANGYTFVGSGQNNTATGYMAMIVGGQNHTATGIYTGIFGGGYGLTRGITGNTVFPASNSPFLTYTSGQSQTSLLIIGKQTTDATPAVITSDGAAASTTNQVILPNNSAYYFRGEVIAGKTAGGDTKGWFIEGVIKRGANAASTAIVGTATVTSNYADAGASTWAVTATADTTNGGLKITVTGQASTTIRWVAQIRTTEMTY